MRILERPIPIHQLTEALARRGDPQRLLGLMSRRSIADEKGRYLHWDELRRKPQDGDLTPEEAWFAVRTARVAASQFVPLKDTANRRFSYCEPPRLRAALRYIDLNAGGLLGTEEQRISPSDGSRYFARSLAEEPFASSFIEGAATTRQRAKQLIFDQRTPRSRDELMVLNNFRGMEFIKTMVNEPLTPEAILETHRIITQDTLDDPANAGSLRQADDVFVEDGDGEILHRPPPFVSLPERLNLLCTFANTTEDESTFIHPVVRAIILHFALAYDHPFVDGNGRTARALFYWSALRAGYWLTEYVSISSVISEAKLAYGAAFLKTETDESDLTYFLLHQVDVLRTAIERMLRYAARKREEVTEFQQRVLESDSEFNARQSILLNDAARNRISSTTIGGHERRHNVSRLTARSDLEELVQLGLFKKRKQGRQNIYVPAADIVARLTARIG